MSTAGLAESTFSASVLDAMEVADAILARELEERRSLRRRAGELCAECLRRNGAGQFWGGILRTLVRGGTKGPLHLVTPEDSPRLVRLGAEEGARGVDDAGEAFGRALFRDRTNRQPTAKATRARETADMVRFSSSSPRCARRPLQHALRAGGRAALR